MREFDPEVAIPAIILFIWVFTIAFLFKAHLESKGK